MIEERLAELAVLSSGVMLTVVADTSGYPTASLVHSFVKVTAGRVSVAIAHATGVGLLANGWFPGQVVEEVFALLAIATLGVVGAIASAVYHVLFVIDTVERKTVRSVTVARAGTSDNHLLDGVVVLFADLAAVVQQIVAEGVQTREVDAEVGHLQQILNFLRVGILDRQIARQDSVVETTYVY